MTVERAIVVRLKRMIRTLLAKGEGSQIYGDTWEEWVNVHVHVNVNVCRILLPLARWVSAWVQRACRRRGDSADPHSQVAPTSTESISDNLIIAS